MPRSKIQEKEGRGKCVLKFCEIKSLDQNEEIQFFKHKKTYTHIQMYVYTHTASDRVAV